MQITFNWRKFCFVFVMLWVPFAAAKVEVSAFETDQAVACRSEIIRLDRQRRHWKQALGRLSGRDSLKVMNLVDRAGEKVILDRMSFQVEDYLRLTKTEFEEVPCALEETQFGTGYLILPSGDSWMSASAKLLKLLKVDMILQPWVLRDQRYGYFHSPDRKVVLAFPPWTDSSYEFLSHETYHAFLVSWTNARGVHFTGGQSTTQGRISKSYPNAHWTELGAYVETLVSRIQMSGAAEPGTPLTDVQLAVEIMPILYFLNDLASEIVASLDALILNPNPEIRLIFARSSQRLSLLDPGRKGGYGVTAYSILHHSELDLRAKSLTYTKDGLPESARFADMSAEDQARILTRMEVLKQLFGDFGDEILYLISEYQPERSAGQWARQILRLRPLIRDLNQEWLKELSLPSDDQSWQLDEVTHNAIDSQRRCQELLR